MSNGASRDRPGSLGTPGLNGSSRDRGRLNSRAAAGPASSREGSQKRKKKKYIDPKTQKKDAMHYKDVQENIYWPKIYKT